MYSENQNKTKHSNEHKSFSYYLGCKLFQKLHDTSFATQKGKIIIYNTKTFSWNGSLQNVANMFKTAVERLPEQ